MALPKHIRPEYSTTIPSTGKRIKYQPFSVKEEKILVLAAESGDTDEITNAVSNVLTNCVTSPADFSVESLALFDVEYLFLKARSKSAGEKITVVLRDPNDSDFAVEHEIDIDKIAIKKDDKHTDLISINKDTKIKMKYPDISFFNEGIQLNSIPQTTELIARCIESIVIGDEVYSSVDMERGEIEEFIEGLTTKEFNLITQFFVTMPRLRHTIKKRNENTGEDFVVLLEGLADFF